VLLVEFLFNKSFQLLLNINFIVIFNKTKALVEEFFLVNY